MSKMSQQICTEVQFSIFCNAFRNNPLYEMPEMRKKVLAEKSYEQGIKTATFQPPLCKGRWVAIGNSEGL